MKFTEREMTVAVKAVAQQLMLATRPLGRGSVDARWDRLAPIERYEKLSAAGDLVLPVLLALPERPTVGATPAFTAEEYDAAAGEAADARGEQTPKARKRLVAVTARLARAAVAAMPVRQDPDALIVPDHL
ncbi:hypothetical protein GCM10009737_13130 [Nocardioides lentus]|uniref:Uncharacterized protein n=1 Tax=Nocardioides lentus TaxID=338077 RepID=A0ABP5AG30_9ACTN